MTTDPRYPVGRFTYTPGQDRGEQIETIDGESASASARASAFVDAGLRLTTAGLRYYASLKRGD